MKSKHIIQTIPEKCRVCYTCVRECPAKAIRIISGQAEIIPDRCIGCGKCVNVCSQEAKKVKPAVRDLKSIVESSKGKVHAIVAPSFPAEFNNMSHKKMVGLLRKIGFDYVHEVAFGADLVANRLSEEDDPTEPVISTTCPAIVSYIEKYHPSLSRNLMTIASPMIVMARVLRQKFSSDIKIVFIGPCIAKKFEAKRKALKGEVDLAITFTELHKYISKKDINLDEVEEFEFDEPRPSLGTVFPLSGGLLQAANIPNDLFKNTVLSTDGSERFVTVLKELEKGRFQNVKLVDLLCCEGCIMGPGMECSLSKYERAFEISKYANKVMSEIDSNRWRENSEKYKYLDMQTSFEVNDMRLPQPTNEEIQAILRKMGKFTVKDELNCEACGYKTCLEHAIAIHEGLAESEMCLPYTIEKLKSTANELTHSHSELSDAKQALIQSEKLASMGQLAAGIAHEVNNPLGIVLLYTHLLLDECDKSSSFYKDLKMIVDQAERCKTIVGGLLNFARKNKLSLMNVNLHEVISKIIKTLIVPGNIQIEVLDSKEPVNIEVDPDQISQVVINLVNNSIEVMPNGGKITVSTSIESDSVMFAVKDDGPGISEKNIKKIFEPFFTTKQIGKGTGLGLAVSYGIVKMHKGSIEVKSNANKSEGPTGAEFRVKLPLQQTIDKKII